MPAAPNPPTWRFRRIPPGEKHIGPTHGEHLATGGVVEPLVRESIQNSLDATVTGQPTKMAFSLGTVQSTAGGRFLDALRPHLETDQVARWLPEGLPSRTDSIRFLAIEDSNTRGLEGEPTLWDQTNADGSKNHFFRFWHQVGQPSGEVKRRGSWGVGKVVFSNASRIRTFFGLTLRQGDPSPVLMGEASLVIHKQPNDGSFCHWYGYCAQHELQGTNYVPMPILDPDFVREFSQAFAIARDAPGLTVVVPYVRQDINLNDLACAVVDNFFFAILEGRLEVSLRDGSQSIQLEQSTIDREILNMRWQSRSPKTKEEVGALLRIARWQVNLDDNAYLRLETVGGDSPYALSGDRFPAGSLQRLSEEFTMRSQIAVRIPVCVRPKGGTAETEDVRVVLEREESLRSSNVPHLRSGINISKMRQAGTGVRGLLVVGDDPDTRGGLDKLLQASEGPAHLNWETKGESFDRAKTQYEDAYKIITFMRNVVENLVALLSTPQDVRDVKTLAPYFPDFDQLGTGDGSSPGNRRGGWGRDRPEPTPPAPLPPGVIEGVVRVLSFADRRLVAVHGATVEQFAGAAPGGASLSTAMSNDQGRFRFENIAPGEYRIAAQKFEVGAAQKPVALGADQGLHIELLLRKPAKPKQYIRLQLSTGFRIQGNPEYAGEKKPIRVQLAYAAWGGSKSYHPADFCLTDESLTVSFGGVREAARSELVSSANTLRLTPIADDFFVQVEGFDIRRALNVDVRTLDDPAQNEEADEATEGVAG